MTDTLPTHVSEQAARTRRPVVDQCDSKWHDETNIEKGGLPTTNSTFGYITDCIRAPKFQRLSAALLLTLIVGIVCWRNFLSAAVQENRAIWKSLQLQADPNHNNLFGANKRVHFPDMQHIGYLDEKYLPRRSRTESEKHKNKRLIFIGDIHGCMDELHALLKKAKFNPKHDHIITAGDMINKGPKTKEVIDFLIKHDASCVRGNHEDRILLLAKQIAASGPASQEIIEPEAESNDMTAASRKSKAEHHLAKSLTKKEIEWLSKCPVILRVGKLGKFGELLVVHGGLLPQLALEQQDPMAVMNMRVIDLATHMPSHKHSQKGAIPWFQYWNKYQRLLSAQGTLFGTAKKRQHATVVYGHDSRKGLQMHAYTKGLDSGCVNGNKLTAWVIGDLGHHEEIVQVKCQS